MSSKYTKYCNNVTCETVDGIYNMLPSTSTIKFKCERCGKEVTQPTSYVVYTYNEKKFCSYNCKQKYIKENPEEEELSISEYRAKKYTKIRKESSRKRLEKYYEDKKKKE